MNILDKIATMDNMVEALSITILHSLWQGLLIAVLLGIILKILRRKSAETRYLASLSAMLVLLVVVVSTFLITFQSEENLNTSSGLMPSIIYEDLSELSISSKSTKNSLSSLLSSFYNNTVETIKTYSDMIFICWLVGVGFFSLRFISGLYYIQKIKTQKVQPVTEYWQEKLEVMCAKMNISLKVSLFQSDLVEVPTVVGWLKPVILMPVSMLSQIPVAEIEAILAHELAHIRRFDYLFNILQSIIEILLFFNPAAWWISVCINDERENCCDDLALKATGSVKAYVNALANLAQTQYNTPEFSLSVMGKKGSVLYRIKRIVAKGNNQLESANALSQKTLGRFTAALFTLFLLVFFTVSSGYKPSNAMPPEWKTDQVKTIFLDDTTKKKKLKVIEIAVEGNSSEIAQDSNVWVNEEIFTIEDGDTIMHNIVGIGEGGTWVGKNMDGSFDGVDEIIEFHSENDSLLNTHDVKVMYLKNGKMIREELMQYKGDFYQGDFHFENDSLNSGKGKKIQVNLINGNNPNLPLGDSTKKQRNIVFIGKDSLHTGKHHDAKVRIVSTNEGKDPLYVIDGRVQKTNKEIFDLDPHEIKRMDVLKGESAIAMYGEKGKDGVILITTKNNKESKENQKKKIDLIDNKNIESDSTFSGKHHVSRVKIVSPNGVLEPLYVIDGKIQTEINDLDPNSIKNIEVLKDEAAIAKYGDKGKNGVIIITTKSFKEPKEKEKVKTKVKVKKFAESDSNLVVDIKDSNSVKIKSSDSMDDVTIFIDGFESSQKSLEALDPTSIATIEVIKGEKAVEKFGEVSKKGVILVKTKKGTGPVVEKQSLVTKSALAQSVIAYPNPTEGEMNISFELKENEKVSIEIFDLSGKKVETLLNKSMAAGKHQVTWDSKDLPSGSYLLNISTKNEKIERKVLLNK
ncbi:M56 family metallopeptidase [Flexithrix dorotheae]|uniref:M56 family metallopeptidase n=1 Tax=Flexithrix dorotheae TaxID=70993 RepID=UPI00038239CC|nr:M56 family metallopeptidase [Flexithrix dorotheae]